MLTAAVTFLLNTLPQLRPACNLDYDIHCHLGHSLLVLIFTRLEWDCRAKLVKPNLGSREHIVVQIMGAG